MARLMRLSVLLALVTVVTVTHGYSVNDSDGFKNAADMLERSVNLSYNPCNNFYDFVCSKYHGGSTFAENDTWIFERVSEQLPKIGKNSSLTEQVFMHGYKSCLLNVIHPQRNAFDIFFNILREDAGGLPMLTNNSAETTWKDVFTLMGDWEFRFGLHAFFTPSIAVDENGTRSYSFSQPISDSSSGHRRDVYEYDQEGFDSDNSKAWEQKLDDAVQFFQTCNFKLGNPVSNESIQDSLIEVMMLEKELVLHYMSMVTLYNNAKSYVEAKYANRTEMKSVFPYIDWEAYFTGQNMEFYYLNSTANTTIDFYSLLPLSYFSNLNSLIGSNRITPDVAKNYLGYRFYTANKPLLNDQVSVLINSTRASKFCIAFINKVMPHAVGYIYVSSRPDHDVIRADVLRISQDILNAFVGMVVNLDWVDDESRAAILQKKEKVDLNVGWPSWFDFESTELLDKNHIYYHEILDIEIEDIFNIYLAMTAAAQKTYTFGLVDSGGLNVYDVAMINAFYDFNQNELIIPLGIVTWPSYDLNFPQAINYGGIGSIIGHELVHGFDNLGIMYDEAGNQRCSWNRCSILSENSSDAFDSMAQCVVQQYSQKCCPLASDPRACADGKKTQGENIADIGGVKAAYKAYRKHVAFERSGIEEDRMPGFEQLTPNQVFWIGFAHKWCSNMPDDYAKLLMSFDPHSPATCRVNQVLQNIPEFVQDFKCQQDSFMYPKEEDRCDVWTN